MSDVVYGLVREFLRYGPPASRNRAFEAYQDPRFARAVRIYQFLASVRDDLEALSERGAVVDVKVVNDGEPVALTLRYDKEPLTRTAWLRPEEWALVQEDPAFGRLLSRFDVPAQALAQAPTQAPRRARSR